MNAEAYQALLDFLGQSKKPEATPIIVQGCRLFRKEDGSYDIFNTIGLGWGNSRTGAHRCWETEIAEIEQFMRKLAHEADAMRGSV
jgi:hypothetical protein